MKGSHFPTNMTIKGGRSQACAACKYRRRRCNKDCPLAPHFPADQPNSFRSAHRLYGVSNIMKVLKQIPLDTHGEAMRSIIYESDIRAKFPVTGCLGIINHLSFQLHHALEELRNVRTQLVRFRESRGECSYMNNSPDVCPSSQLQLGLQTNDNEAVQLYQYQQYNDAGGGMPEYMADGINGVYLEENESVVKPARVHEHQFYYGSDNNVAVKNNMMMTSARVHEHQQEMDVPQDYDDIPFDTIADDDHVESKEACESSAESAFEGNNNTQSLQHVSQNDLKSAAAYVSLIRL